MIDQFREVAEAVKLEVKPENRRKIGICGAGGIVDGAHLPAYKKAGLEVVAIFDTDNAKAQDVAKRHGIPTVYKTLAELLSDANVEIVDIAVPAAAQPEIFAQVAAAKKHILAQKPFATTVAAGEAMVKQAKDAGINVFHAVPSVAGAIKAADAGVDGLVIEGTEGGGFKSPEEVGLIVLIQAIRKHTDLPIIAAGGIVDGVGMAAAFAAGAEGIQMGTRFVSSKESPVHENFKNSILDANEQGTWILNKKSKPCIRALKTEFTQKIHEVGVMEMSEMGRIQDLYFGGDMNAAPALTGQSAGLIDEVKPVAQIIEETISEFNETCQKMSAQKF